MSGHHYEHFDLYDEAGDDERKLAAAGRLCSMSRASARACAGSS